MNSCGRSEAGVIPMQALVKELLQISQDIRHVAVSCNGELVRARGPDLKNGSSSDEETFEELVLGPTLLTMVRQHGRAKPWRLCFRGNPVR